MGCFRAKSQSEQAWRKVQLHTRSLTTAGSDRWKDGLGYTYLHSLLLLFYTRIEFQHRVSKSRHDVLRDWVVIQLKARASIAQRPAAVCIAECGAVEFEAHEFSNLCVLLFSRLCMIKGLNMIECSDALCFIHSTKLFHAMNTPETHSDRLAPSEQLNGVQALR